MGKVTGLPAHPRRILLDDVLAAGVDVSPTGEDLFHQSDQVLDLAAVHPAPALSRLSLRSAPVCTPACASWRGRACSLGITSEDARKMMTQIAHKAATIPIRRMVIENGPPAECAPCSPWARVLQPDILALGSSASRRPSPKTSSGNTVNTIIRPGTTARCGAVQITRQPLATTAAHDALGGSTPPPRNESARPRQAACRLGDVPGRRRR